MNARYGPLLLFIIFALILVMGCCAAFKKQKEHFEELKFAPPANQPPMNNCYEYAALDKVAGSGLSLGWSLGNSNWDIISRAKILSLMVPSKDSMMQTVDRGFLLNGRCEIPSEVEPLLGVDSSSCVLANKHQLKKTSDGRCFVEMNDREKVLEIVDDAYKIYDADKLKIIANLEYEIKYYKDAKQSLDQQIPIMDKELETYSNLLVPLIKNNQNIRIYNENLTNCIRSTNEAIQVNNMLLGRIVADITNTLRKIQVLVEMMNAYQPYTNKQAPAPPPPPPPPEPQPTCRMAYTNFSRIGGGKMIYLDRHNVACAPDEILTSFRLGTEKKQEARYEYRCCQIPYKLTHNMQETVTGWTVNAEQKTEYLDRQVPDCGNRFINTFRLERDDAYKNIRYKLTCDSIGVKDEKFQPVMDGCYTMTTDWVKDQKTGGVTELNAHNVACKDGEGLTQFSLQRNPEHTHFRYSYQCCKPAAAPKLQPAPEPVFVPAQYKKPEIQQSKYGDIADFTCPMPLNT